MSKEGEVVKIGVTGGIGAGKSTICEIFSNLDIPVYNADQRARFLMENDPELISKIKNEFSGEAYLENGLNRSFLSKKVFNDETQLKKLDDLVHPAVFRDFDLWVKDHQSKELVVKEAALLFESGSYKDLDKVILVYCPLEIRINRILLRDEYRNRSDVEKIIEKQMSDTEKKKLADFVIVNDDQRTVIPQVMEILEKLKIED